MLIRSRCSKAKQSPSAERSGGLRIPVLFVGHAAKADADICPKTCSRSACGRAVIDVRCAPVCTAFGSRPSRRAPSQRYARPLRRAGRAARSYAYSHLSLPCELPTMRAPTPLDRRLQSRVSVRYQIQLRPINGIDPSKEKSGPRLCSCVSRDICEGGVGVLVDYPYPVDFHFLVSFERKDDGDLKCVTSRFGSVAWINPLPSGGRYMLGIRFDDGRDE